MAERQGTIVICDGCAKESPLEFGILPNNWWQMDVTLHTTEYGGNGAKNIHACSERCIRKAIVQGFERQDEHELTHEMLETATNELEN